MSGRACFPWRLSLPAHSFLAALLADYLAVVCLIEKLFSFGLTGFFRTRLCKLPGFFMCVRLAGCTKKGPKPQGAKPSRTRSKSPAPRQTSRSRSKRRPGNREKPQPAPKTGTPEAPTRHRRTPRRNPAAKEPKPERPATRTTAEPQPQPRTDQRLRSPNHRACQPLEKTKTEPPTNTAQTTEERKETLPRRKDEKSEEKSETWRKHQLGKSRTNTERHCQRAPKGLTGREAEAQAGADGPEGGVQAAQAAARNGRKRSPLRMVL